MTEIIEADELDTHQKALQINLDANKYGTIAEIGAGQEVAGWFFRVGAAAGSVAKTMSAYDMQVSDAIYGRSSRYVSRDRIDAMIDHEWELLLERLDETRGKDTRFFSFANTISARNYHGSNICHGWMGIRFQTEPRSEPSTIALHLHLGDPTNILQQRAIGILGVNLIYAAYHYNKNLNKLAKSLLDGLTLERVEVDYISFDGPAFEGIDPREAVISLLKNKVTSAIGFCDTGTPCQPMDFLYKRPVIIERGNFKTVEKIHDDLLTSATRHYLKEGIKCKREPAEILEISTNVANPTVVASPDDIIERLDRLQKLHRPVLVTSYSEGYHLTKFLRKYTPNPIRFTMGIAHLTQILDEKHYQHLPGGIVEGIGKLVGAGVKIYVHPMDVKLFNKTLELAGIEEHDWLVPEEGLATISNVRPLNAVRHLYSYLFETGALLPMTE